MNDQEYESLRAYLASEDERERSNRQAEQAKQHIKRRCAMKFADANSQLEAITFAPLASCVHCDDPLTDAARSPVHGCCRQCFDEAHTQPAPVVVVDKPDRASGWILTGLVCGTVILAALIGCWKAGWL